MAGIGGRVHEFFVHRRVLDRRVDLLRHQHAAEGQIAGGDALGEGHEVGFHPPMTEGEPFAGAPEAGDDLVGDQQNAVAVADLPQTGEVSGGRDDDAAGTHDGFADDGGDGIGTVFENCVLHGVRRADAGVAVARPAVRVWRQHLVKMRHHGAEHLLVAGQAGGAHGRHGHAVVPIAARDDFHLVRLTHALPVVAGEFKGGFIGLRAAGGEIGSRHVAVGQAHDAFGQADGGLVGEPGIGGRIRQFFHLAGGGVGQFLAPVADIDVPQARQPVDVFAPVVGGQHRTLAADKDFGGGVVFRVVQRMDEMALIRFEQRGDVVHEGLPLRCPRKGSAWVLSLEADCAAEAAGVKRDSVAGVAQW